MDICLSVGTLFPFSDLSMLWLIFFKLGVLNGLGNISLGIVNEKKRYFLTALLPL